MAIYQMDPRNRRTRRQHSGKVALSHLTSRAHHGITLGLDGPHGLLLSKNPCDLSRVLAKLQGCVFLVCHISLCFLGCGHWI